MDVSARSQDTFGAGYHERIAQSKTTHAHGLRRGTYRSKRRRGGGAFSGWRLALPSGLFAIIIATGALMVLGAGAALAFFAGDLPSPQDLAKDPLAQSTKVYDRTGTELLYQFSEENREVVSYQDIPQVLIDATVSAEDKTFWTNPGVDIVGTIRAVFSDVTGRSTGQGGAPTCSARWWTTARSRRPNPTQRARRRSRSPAHRSRRSKPRTSSFRCATSSRRSSAATRPRSRAAATGSRQRST